MKYTIVSSDRSPFGRICRMFMLSHKIDFEFKALNFIDDAKAAEELAKITPINKVPLLIDGDQTIFDSRVIINYLLKKHNLAPLTVEEENLVSVIYGAMDAGVILFLMKKDGFDLERSNFFVRRNRERVFAALDFARPLARKLQDNWNYPAMALYAFLYWAELRVGLFKAADYPELAAFQRAMESAPGVRETGF